MAAVTYTSQKSVAGQKFTCPRCLACTRTPTAAKSIRCECGWWYTNVGHDELVEAFKPRIGGSA